MAIQMRRGKYSAFLPSKMKPGEWAVVQGEDPGTSDGLSVYMAFAAGVVKRMATYTDMLDDVRTAIDSSIGDIKATLTAKVEATNTSITEAEKGRVAAEATRASNEATRVSNESKRVTAEAARVTETAAAIADCEEAAKEAKEAVVEDHKVYFKRVADENGDTWLVPVDLTI